MSVYVSCGDIGQFDEHPQARRSRTARFTSLCSARAVSPWRYMHPATGCQRA